ncbi:hypothetical protein DIZ27_23165 [Streptomyces sp. NWU339]|uniref:hypothetical protein n=1 Tax=Streptomyces sp. NWU339 TaxID=2185284 RepID=UPI000D67B303|nr:hypothetical protein [Streptomyces sp. NWU339]PWI08396.1 hypothetical protein DIZ27_23165 [Streptomyces sp. NWU339]
MARRKREDTPAEEPAEELEERSPLAGGCVLVVLAGAALAGVWAVSPEAGVLAVWVAGVAAVWWSARRRVSVSSAPPPPQEGRPSCRECAGHELIGVTPLESEEGMLIYKTSPPDRPNHTHIHVAAGEVTSR